MFAGDRLQRPGQISREGRAQVERFPRHRVVEREPCRVEEMSLGRQASHSPATAPAIHIVAHDRMADGRKVNANLMSASRMEMCTKKVPRVEPRKA